MLIPRKLYFSGWTQSKGWGKGKKKQIKWLEWQQRARLFQLWNISAHQQGKVWLAMISGCSNDQCLPGTFRERLLKIGFFHPRQCYLKKKKNSKRKSTEKTCPHLEISTEHIRQCLFHMSERQEGFGAAERCWICWQPCTFLPGWQNKHRSSRNANPQCLSTPIPHH